MQQEPIKGRIASVRVLSLLFWLIASPGLAQEEEPITTETEETTAGGEESKGVEEETRRIEFDEEMTVTATRTEEKVEKAPASTSVVTDKEIEKMHAPTLDEALRREVGVSVLKFRGPVDNHTMTIMRGFQGQQRVLLMLDGIPLNSVITGGIPWSEMPVDEIERIEVVRGPYSALYGGYALGGVINSIMKTPDKEIAEARMGYGSYGTGNAHLQYGNRVFNDRLSFIIGLDRWWTDGYVVSTVERPRGNTPANGTETVVTGFRRTTDVTGAPLYTVGDGGKQVFNRDYYTGKLSFDLTSHSNLSLTALYGEWTLDQPTYNTYLRDANGFPVISGTLNIEGNRVTLSERNFFPITREDEASLYALQYSLEVTPAISVKANLGYQSQFNRETEFRDVPTNFLVGLGFPTGTTAAWTTRDRDSNAIHGELLSNMQLGERNLLTIGVLYQTAKGDQRIPVLRDRRVPEALGIASKSGGEQQTQAIYLQDQLRVLDNLTVYLGGRYDRWENTDGFQEVVETTGFTSRRFEDRSQNSFNPKVSVVYSPFTSTNLRASVGTAFRPPTLDDLYVNSVHGTSRTIGNPELDPEEVFAWEVGFVQDLPTGTRIGATYFVNEIEDMIFRRTIGVDPIDPAIQVRQLENADEAETKGIEVDLTQRITSYLGLFANYTRMDAEITSYPANAALEGNTIPLVPEYIYNIGLDLTAGSFIGSLVYQGVGDAFARDDNTDIVNGVRGGHDPYKVLDAKVIYNGWEKVSTSLAVNNILDKEYFQSFGRFPGRTWFGELIVHF
ncbi:MAG: TonB-dependent receptor [Candidatus Manganitrophus sp.]|nr:TonB-dependent receptor [Candidatus Manganitrophus sp.]WDT72253.1 MAG: TonB-dependent receptor [Candidatus Manganitrophus sp.]WDT75502.1 MAG: TonB-dependent receptor [Candidatus Manganitrophus sp.]